MESLPWRPPGCSFPLSVWARAIPASLRSKGRLLRIRFSLLHAGQPFPTGSERQCPLSLCGRKSESACRMLLPHPEARARSDLMSRVAKCFIERGASLFSLSFFPINPTISSEAVPLLQPIPITRLAGRSLRHLTPRGESNSETHIPRLARRAPSPRRR